MKKAGTVNSTKTNCNALNTILIIECAHESINEASFIAVAASNFPIPLA